MAARLPATLVRQIDGAVQHFLENREKIERAAKTLYALVSEHSLLRPHIHSVKYRVKDVDRLREFLPGADDEGPRHAFGPKHGGHP